MGIQDFSEWAEAQFSTLCAEHGAVRNKAHQDRMGWDYIVEFPHKARTDLPLDRQSGPTTARVQIKSKTGGKPSVDMKLSNALRFCQESDPCFVVLFWRSRDGLTQQSFAREFDESLISQVLRKAREIDSNGPKPANSVKISIRFEDEHDHSHDLLQWIEEKTGENPVDYANKKSSLNNSIGYDEASHIGKFTILLEDIDLLIENSIGLREDVPVIDTEYRDNRFNIPARIPDFSGKPTKFSIRVEPKKAELVFKGKKGSEAVFPGDFRASGLNFGEEYARASFISERITCKIDPISKMDLNYSFRSDTKETLRHLENQIKFNLMRGKKIEVILKVEGHDPLKSLPIKIPGKPERNSIWLSQIISCLSSFHNDAYIPLISLDEILSLSEKIGRFVRCCIDGDLTTTVNNPTAGKDELRVKGLTYFLSVDVGCNTFQTVIMRPLFNAVWQGQDSVRFTFGDPVSLFREVVPGNSTEHAERLRQQFKTIMTRLGPGYATINEGEVLEGGLTIN